MSSGVKFWVLKSCFLTWIYVGIMAATRLYLPSWSSWGTATVAIVVMGLYIEARYPKAAP